MATESRYGPVDSAALERLRESFDTRKILDAVDKVDDIRCQIDHLRDQLLKLHAMADDLINDAEAASPPPEYPIWELAEEISVVIWEWPRHLVAVRDTVDQIVTLTPDPDEDMENE
jgi:hypothetical protein